MLFSSQSVKEAEHHGALLLAEITSVTNFFCKIKKMSFLKLASFFISIKKQKELKKIEQ